MKGIAITHKGIEDISALEIKELIKKESKTEESVVKFDATKEELAKLCYRSQSVIKILELITEFDIGTLDDLKQLKKVDIKHKGSFVVRCLRVGEHDFTSLDVEKEAGEIIYEKIKQKVDLKNPDLTLLIYIYNNKAYLGIDYSGFDLSKREYKIFSGARALKGTIAYSLVRMSGYKPTETLLDPFSISGEIPIETALFATKFSANYFSKEKFAFNKFLNFKFEEPKKYKTKVLCFDSLLKNIKAAQKNAKIAGIDKNIKFSKTDLEWIDTKFKEDSVDRIVTRIPELTKYQKPNQIEKLYKEFFNQAEFILKKKGKIVAIAKNLNLFKKFSENFNILEERTISLGKEELSAITLENS
ncbi:THUMP domain-containing protein [Nanoarchaeota archaeon]